MEVPESPKWVSIGYVVRPHGVRGEMKVIGVDEGVARFCQATRVLLESQGGRRQEYGVERFRARGRIILLKLKGVGSREEAESWRSSEVSIPIEEVPPLEPGSYYAFQLVGLEVRTSSGERLGTLTEILELPASDVWVVREGEKEILVPAVAEIIEDVDIEGGTIRVKALEGLTE
jgi:16S rRNA processing protein RimM